MSRIRHFYRNPLFIAVGLTLAMTCAHAADTPEHIVVNQKDVKWAAAPAAFPKGLKFSVLYGDPKSAGNFVMRVMTPSNYKLPPHWHTHAQQVTVLSGALYVKTFDEAGGGTEQTVRPGGFLRLPAKTRQYTYTKSPTVFEIHAEGPFDVNYVNPNDDPVKWAERKLDYMPYKFEDSERKAKADGGAPSF